MPVLTEVCVDSASGVRVAAAAGADRVELCAALEVGGVTPSMALIEQSLESAAGSGLLVQVLIRPRPGDFLYDIDEIRCMETDIAAAVAAGAHGVVFGALRADGTVDADFTARLVASAMAAGRASGRRPTVTFHRAFDMTADPLVALDSLHRNGIDRVLTSGQATVAMDGVELLAELVRRSAAADGSPTIMAGGGIRPDSAAELVRLSGVQQVHFSARRTIGSPMEHHNPAVAMGGGELDEYVRNVTDPAAVRATITALR